MKSLRFLFIVCFFPIYGFTQDTTDIYLDEYGLRISKEEYYDHPKNNEGYFYLEGISDNGKVYFIEKRVVNGRVSLEVVNELRTHLQNLSQSEINENNYMVVNYFPGPDACNQSGNSIAYNSNLKSYQKRINKLKYVSQFFVYKSNEGLDVIKEGLDWYKDENNLWQTHFFKHHYPCSSFVIVKPDGHFFLIKGEHNTRQVFIGLNELEKIN